MQKSRFHRIDEPKRNIVTSFRQIEGQRVVNILTGACTWYDKLATHAFRAPATRSRKPAK